MKTIAILSFLMLYAICSHAQLNNYNIVFRPDQTTLEDKQKSSLIDITKTLKVNTTICIYPLAHDTVQDLFYFSMKAREQAQSISDYAKTIGFQVIGMPRNFPSGYNGFSVGVNLRFVHPEILDSLNNKKEEPALGLDAHYPDKPSQYFIINPKRDTVLYGDEGTKLLLRAGCLKSDQNVKIELKEFYKLEDYLKNGLQTVSNGRQLVSGGSLYIDARENNSAAKQVKINQDIGIGVDFTNGKQDTAMKIFIKDPSQKSFNWILPPTRTVRQTWSMTEITYDAHGTIIQEKTYNSKEEWDKHLKEEAAKAAMEERKRETERLKAEQERLKAEEEAKLHRENDMRMQSKLKIHNLGYINCDRFSNEPTMDIVANADVKYTAEYYLIYPEINSVLKGDAEDTKVRFFNVSKVKQAILIAVCFIGKQAYFFKCL